MPLSVPFREFRKLDLGRVNDIKHWDILSHARFDASVSL